MVRRPDQIFSSEEVRGAVLENAPKMCTGDPATGKSAGGGPGTHADVEGVFPIYHACNFVSPALLLRGPLIESPQTRPNCTRWCSKQSMMMEGGIWLRGISERYILVCRGGTKAASSLRGKICVRFGY